MVNAGMPRKLFITIVALLNVAPLFAQFDFPAMGGRSAALGGVSVMLDDAMSTMSGNAMLASAEKASVGLGVRQEFLAQGMGYAMLGGVVPTGFGAASASVVHFGSSEYNEQNISLAYAIPIGKAVALSAVLHYLHSGTADPYYDPINRVTFSLSLGFCPSDELMIGFKAFNPVAVKADAPEEQRVPTLFCLGLSYRLVDGLLSVAEVEKRLDQQATLRFGLEYVFKESYFLRVGVNTFPVAYSFGFGMEFGGFGADLAAQIHNVLGLTPQLSLNYSF